MAVGRGTSQPGARCINGRRVVAAKCAPAERLCAIVGTKTEQGRHGMAESVTVGEQRMAVPRDVAARISRLSLRKVDYWARTRLVEPTVDTRGSTGRVRLYGFLDLLALVVAAELNSRGVSGAAYPAGCRTPEITGL